MGPAAPRRSRCLPLVSPCSPHPHAPPAMCASILRRRLHAAAPARCRARARHGNGNAARFPRVLRAVPLAARAHGQAPRPERQARPPLRLHGEDGDALEGRLLPRCQARLLRRGRRRNCRPAARDRPRDRALRRRRGGPVHPRAVGGERAPRGRQSDRRRRPRLRRPPHARPSPGGPRLPAPRRPIQAALQQQRNAVSFRPRFAMKLLRPLSHTLLIAALSGAPAAAAAPTKVTLVPPDGARFLRGQRFDIRVEGQGQGAYAAELWIDGEPRDFTSGQSGTSTTDGISAAGWGGFNLRGASSEEPGVHTLTARFQDATGAVTVSSRIRIEDPFSGAKIGGRPTKNIIIMLGDGMGVAHRTAARLVKVGVTAGQPDGFLAMDQFPGTGLVSTHSLNSIVTDSAPGMACYASGSHTANGQEGGNPAHVTNVFFAPRIEHMAEYLHSMKGTSLGLVSTADLEDATPAANAVHTGDRNQGTGIVDQYLDESDAEGSYAYGTGPSVLLGGGRRWFLPASAFEIGR